MSSSESLRLPSCAPSGVQPALGFLPSSRHHRRSPPVRGSPIPRDVPPTGFLNLSTVCSASGFAGLFHPAATSRVSVQGFAPVPQRYRLVAGLCLLALVAHALTGRPAATRAQLSFEALIRGAIRSSKSVVGLPRRRSPLRFSSSRSSRPSRAATPLQRSCSARDLLTGVFAFALPRRRSPRR